MKHSFTAVFAVMTAFAAVAADGAFVFNASARIDPARQKGILCSGYKASSDTSVPARYEFVGENEKTALRIVSHGDNDLEKNWFFDGF